MLNKAFLYIMIDSGEIYPPKMSQRELHMYQADKKLNFFRLFKQIFGNIL